MRSGIVHHKSDRKPCVIPTADRNTVMSAFLRALSLSNKQISYAKFYYKERVQGFSVQFCFFDQIICNKNKTFLQVKCKRGKIRHFCLVFKSLKMCVFSWMGCRDQQFSAGTTEVSSAEKLKFTIELIEAWVRWIDTHMKSIHMSKIKWVWRVPKSIRLIQNDLSFWIISNKNHCVLLFYRSITSSYDQNVYTGCSSTLSEKISHPFSYPLTFWGVNTEHDKRDYSRITLQKTANLWKA